MELKIKNKLEGFKPFNDIDKQFENAVEEVTNDLDMVMNHYGEFLNIPYPMFLKMIKDDYAFGRVYQFEKSPDKLYMAIAIQRQICKLTWFRTKCFEYGSEESVLCWKQHRQEFYLLKKMLEVIK